MKIVVSALIDSQDLAWIDSRVKSGGIGATRSKVIADIIRKTIEKNEALVTITAISPADLTMPIPQMLNAYRFELGKEGAKNLDLGKKDYELWLEATAAKYKITKEQFEIFIKPYVDKWLSGLGRG